MSPRRAGVLGTVREQRKGSGKWIGLLPPSLGYRGRRTRIPGVYNSRSEARLALNTEILRIQKGIQAKPGAPGGPKLRVRHSVENYIKARTESPTDHISTNTARSYRGALANQICHPRANLGNLQLDRLTPPLVSRWMNDLASFGVGQPSINLAHRLLKAALRWEMEQGTLPTNPAGAVRKTWSKAGKSAGRTADNVLLPTWAELAALIGAPEDPDHRLLIATMAFGGLRWAEAASLDASSVHKDLPQLLISRVLVKPSGEGWIVEADKTGIGGYVPLPRLLWERLVVLANKRERGPAGALPAGRLLFPPKKARGGIIDHSQWAKVWVPARTAAGLTGDPRRNPLDPRHRAINTKDLRAFAASVVVDSGGTLLEAQALLRHSNPNTTSRHYARAMNTRAADPARMSLRFEDKPMTLSERVDRLFEAFLTSFPDAGKCLGIRVPRGRRAGGLRVVGEPSEPRKAAVKKAAGRRRP